MPTSRLSRIATLLQILPLIPTPASPDDDGDGATPAGAYVSPSWGWRLDYDPAQWQRVSESSDEDIDSLVLVPREASIASARVSFHTSPRGSDTIRAHLEEAAAALAETSPGTTVTLAEDANGYPIFQRFGENHWIGSYIISDLPGEADDIIAELDSLAVQGLNGVLIVKATTIPSGYDLIFPKVQTLRDGMSEGGQMLIETGGSQAGGGRPKVLY